MRLYDEFADWWPLLSTPADYAEEAAFYARTLSDACDAPPRRVLELGSGGGNNAVHMKRVFDVTLSDRSRGMLDVSRALNPECEHVEGDMRDLRLDRTFDGVFIHDAIGYLTTRTDVAAALETAFVHCRPGGAVVVAPDFVRETFRPGTDCGGHDGSDRSLRYLEWTWDPDPADDTYTVDYVYALRDAGGDLRIERDRHVEGLFARAAWLDMLGAAGFDATRIAFTHAEVDHPLDVFVGVRRSVSSGDGR